MRKLNRSLCFALLFACLVACGQAGRGSHPTGIPTGEALWTPTLSPIPTETASATPTASITLTRTETLTPTPTYTPTPPVPLAQEGPWLLLESGDELWVLNPDGTGLTRIANFTNDPDFTGDYRLAVAPHGGRLAFFLPSWGPDLMVAIPPRLMLVSLPSTAPQSLTPLHSGVPLPTTSPEGDPNLHVYAALSSVPNLAWSPDGSTLAFLSAQDGPSVDLYAYATRTGTIRRLTSDPTQAINPSWSPDGRYILWAGVDNMILGYASSDGPLIDAIRAIRPDGSDLRTVQTHAGSESGLPYAHQLGWVNNQVYVEYHLTWDCGYHGLTSMNFMTRRQNTILEGAFGSVALDPASGTVLVMIPDMQDAYAQNLCGPTPGPGWHLISVDGTQPPRKIDLEVATRLDTTDQVLGWSPQAQVFFAKVADSLYAIDLQGKVTLIDSPNRLGYVGPEVSPDGQAWALPAADQGLWIVSPTDSATPIFSGSVYHVLWTPDSSALLFTSDGVLYRAAAPDYQPVELGKMPAGALEWVMP